MQIFDSYEEYLRSLPEHKQKALDGYKQSKDGQWYRLVKKREIKAEEDLPSEACGNSERYH